MVSETRLYAMEQDPHEFEGLVVADKLEFQDKIDAFWEPLGPNQVREARIDNDGTLVISESSWEIGYRGLPDDRKAASDERRRVNLAKEKNGELTDAEHLDWSLAEFNEHIGTDSLDHPDVHDGISASELQRNTDRMFEIFHWAGMVTSVVTAGFEPIVKRTLNANQIFPTHVIGNDPRRHENEADHGSIVHPGTKSEFADGAVPATPYGRRILVIGNAMSDTRMAEDAAGSVVLRGRVCKPGGNDQAYLNESFYGDERGPAYTTEGPHYDFVLTVEDFEPLIENILLARDLHS